MFLSFDDGASWTSFQQNLPMTPITDIKVVQQDLAISTMGRSFWILDDVTPLHEAPPAGETHFFQPRDEIRFRAGRRGFGAPAPADPEYPTPGPRFTYRLAADVDSARIDVRDENGDLVRSFESAGSGEETAMTQEMRAPGMMRRGAPTLPTAAGVHRFTWDMRHEGARDGEGNASGRGVLAAPGRYTVELTAGGETMARSLRLRMDPRTVKEGWVHRGTRPRPGRPRAEGAGRAVRGPDGGRPAGSRDGERK